MIKYVGDTYYIMQVDIFNSIFTFRERNTIKYIKYIVHVTHRTKHTAFTLYTLKQSGCKVLNCSSKRIIFTYCLFVFQVLNNFKTCFLF